MNHFAWVQSSLVRNICWSSLSSQASSETLVLPWLEYSSYWLLICWVESDWWTVARRAIAAISLKTPSYSTVTQWLIDIQMRGVTKSFHGYGLNNSGSGRHARGFVLKVAWACPNHYFSEMVCWLRWIQTFLLQLFRSMSWICLVVIAQVPIVRIAGWDCVWGVCTWIRLSVSSKEPWNICL